jgi:hypothetical protein
MMQEAELKKKGEAILRNHLLRCYNDVVKEFPDIKNMPKEEAVDYLLKLREEGKVKITLNTVDNLIRTQIEWIS